jgi:CheY-like chemotaxis protein
LSSQEQERTVSADAVQKVLVVEDDADTADTLRVLLESCGYEVFIARTSQQGIEAARQHDPDVVLCDIGLPDSTGYVVGSVLRQCQCNPLRRARLIAVTGHGETRHRLQALAAGFDEHLVKPVDPMVLLREMQVPH